MNASNYEEVFRCLQDRRDLASNIPDRAGPGVYAIFAPDPNCLLPIQIPYFDIVYIGLASDLQKRNHFNASSSAGHSPRRSLGAILKDKLQLRAIPATSTDPEICSAKFRFDNADEKCLTDWMNCNLEYAIYPFDGDIRELERGLIGFAQPPLNLKDWANPQKGMVREMRDRCKKEAYSIGVREKTQSNGARPRRHVSTLNAKQGFDDTIVSLHVKFDDLLCTPKRNLMDIPRSTAGSGVYLLSDANDNGKIVYVGRTKNLGRRLKNHVASSHNQASFAFKVARQVTGLKPTYKKRGSRQDLLENHAGFRAAFEEAIKWIRTLDVRFVEEPDPIRQALLEILTASRTQATYNEFHTS